MSLEQLRARETQILAEIQRTGGNNALNQQLIAVRLEIARRTDGITPVVGPVEPVKPLRTSDWIGLGIFAASLYYVAKRLGVFQR